ncbi:GPW/gp25 family protein [Paracoccaceae bacterium GXU_MW_L88]
MTVQSFDFTTGKKISGIEHLRKSITRILTTDTETRVMRRDFGADIFPLVDQNMDSVMLVKLYSNTIDAIRKWEKRFSVVRVQAVAKENGVTLTVEGDYLPEGRRVTLEGIEL